MAVPPDPTYQSPGWTSQANTGDVEQGAGPASASALVVPPGAVGSTGVAGAAFPASALVKINPNGATITSVKVNGGSELYPQTDNISVPQSGKLTLAYTGGTPSVIAKEWAVLKNVNDVPGANGVVSISVGGGGS